MGNTYYVPVYEDGASSGADQWQLWSLRIAAVVLLVLAFFPANDSDAESNDPDAPVEGAEASGLVSIESEPAASEPAEAVAAPAASEPAAATRTDSTSANVSAPAEETGAQTTGLIRESQQEVEAKIAAAVGNAISRFDTNQYLPGWRVVQGGRDLVDDGFTDPATLTIFVNADQGQPVEELTFTLLHELGHAVDETWMSSQQRAMFQALREHGPGLDWDEAREDFAEVFVAWVWAGNYQITTNAIAEQPSPVDLIAFCQLMNLDGLSC